MSSEGSSSGITQFGLYRTIDARTEEFLRLSRRRQIRQGCACAAVSTVITVTVVVSVLLVYEYSIVSGSNKNRSYVTKPTWLGFINESADTTPFDAKYSNTKLNFDKTTLKLLPILLKALKQNIFLEKVMEDYTSASPLFDSRKTTEGNYDKNVFSDPRKWFKAPTSRVYAIEFKTSPIVYYQSAMRNTDYMTKIRKIRDYQRILNYFDKMVNDKVTYGSNPSIIKRESPTQRPPELFTTPMIKNIKQPQKQLRSGNYKKYVKKTVTTGAHNCKCPIKLGELLNKLKSNINQLIPYAKFSIAKICNVKKPVQLSKSKPSKTTKKMKVEKITTLKPLNAITTRHFIAKKITSTTEKNKLKIQNQITTEKNKPNIIKVPLDYNKNKPELKIDSIEDSIDTYEKLTTVRNYIEPTDRKKTKLSYTIPMTPATHRISNFVYQRQHNNTAKPQTTVTPTFTRSKPFFSNEEYDEYFATTQNNINNFDMLDLQKLKLIKTEIIEQKNKTKKISVNKSDIVSKSAMKSLSDLMSSHFIPVPKYKNKDFSVQNRIGNIFSEKLTHNKPSFDLLKVNAKTSILDKSNESVKFDHAIHNDNLLGYDNKTDDQISEESKIEQSATSSAESNNQSHSNYNMTAKLKHSSKEVVSNKESLLTSINSMIPRARPVYLEIQRNDWKADDIRDFDLNVDNNFYDIPPF